MNDIKKLFTYEPSVCEDGVWEELDTQHIEVENWITSLQWRSVVENVSVDVIKGNVKDV